MRSCLAGSSSKGFTLIELSIVLVIIGLIVGGVLVGQDLIRAAYVRAQIAQIEKLNTAVNTFRGKFNALPGDLARDVATQFGFTTRGTFAGEGDGNGILEGISADAGGANSPYHISSGETGMFWVDLSSQVGGKLIEGGFSSASPTDFAGGAAGAIGTAISLYLPEAKIGGSNSVYVYYNSPVYVLRPGGGQSANYFGVEREQGLDYWGGAASAGDNQAAPGMTVKQAYDIDRKMDDGTPQFGRVLAIYVSFSTTKWAHDQGPSAPGSLNVGDSDATKGPVVAGDGRATTGDSTTCYDNSGSAGATEQYSITQNNGAGLNCALSFQFQ